mmetsp:Transcript_18311/g.59955  ORF Transcript_18311/g.59955 Transcript_18311/m.59955 type:complete len:256 (+) Transcript_18311:480-1247(+)
MSAIMLRPDAPAGRADKACLLFLMSAYADFAEARCALAACIRSVAFSSSVASPLLRAASAYSCFCSSARFRASSCFFWACASRGLSGRMGGSTAGSAAPPPGSSSASAAAGSPAAASALSMAPSPVSSADESRSSSADASASPAVALKASSPPPSRPAPAAAACASFHFQSPMCTSSGKSSVSGVWHVPHDFAQLEYMKIGLALHSPADAHRPHVSISSLHSPKTDATPSRISRTRPSPPSQKRRLSAAGQPSRP